MNKEKQNNNIPISIKHQYIKDLSFENPLLPKVISLNSEPNVSLDVEINFLTIKNNDHELTLIIKSDAKIDKKILFVLELHYACLISFNFQNDNNKKKEAIIEGAQLLFPFARSIIANVTRDGGFNPLIIQPIDFDRIYKN